MISNSYQTERVCHKKVDGKRCGKKFLSDMHTNCPEHRKPKKGAIK